MSNEVRYVPRFIPTLTEVVDPAILNQVRDKPKPDVQALIEEVQRQIRPVFERRLQEEYERLVRSLLDKPWDEISRHLQREMDQFVQQAVIDYLAHHHTQPSDGMDP